MVNRVLSIADTIGQKNSAFLFGARGVGKTHLSRKFIRSLNQHYETYDLLNFQTYQRYLKNPSLFSEELHQIMKRQRQCLVWVDEIQKIPPLLDEIHSLIETYKKSLRFLLTGSSARKLKRAGANLLAGRALSLRLHPLTHLEVKDIATSDTYLQEILRLGSLPGVIIDQDSPELALKSYIETYLKEEVLEEALVRRVDAFSRFLEVAAQYHGEPINAIEIGKAAHVSGQTVQQYFQILEDTLVGWKLPGWSASVKKQLRTTPKFFLFDNGVANALRGELNIELKESSFRFGKLFECWVVQELFRLNDYCQLDFKFSYWRTNNDIEVDIIISRGMSSPIAAIEIKSSKAPEEKHIYGLKAFSDEYPSAKLYCFCRTPRAYRLSGVHVQPWTEMKMVLQKL